jgi:hypothetical protein
MVVKRNLNAFEEFKGRRMRLSACYDVLFMRNGAVNETDLLIDFDGLSISLLLKLLILAKSRYFNTK